MTKKDTVNFESSLKKLEQIVAKLEDGDINLEDSVKSFEEGIGLVKECQKQLSAAELKVKKLLDSADSVDLDSCSLIKFNMIRGLPSSHLIIIH